MLSIRSWGAAVLLTGVFSGGLSLAQNLQPTGEGPATGTLKVRTSTVVEDVVVIGKKGRGITGLTRDDFQIFEDGKPQAITFFEANTAAVPAQPAPVRLPPDTFSNVPTVQPNQAINVLLMDALNTGGGDQIYVRQQMVKYLSVLPPNIRVGIFMLTTRLRLVQGVTQDSTALRAAINRFAGKASQSEMIVTPAEQQAQDTIVDTMKQTASDTGDAQLAASAQALQDFMQQQTELQQNAQLLTTLNALQALARYLEGIPGRKNLIWFVGSVPLCDPSKCPYLDLYHETQSRLAAARVAVYPVNAGGIVAPYGDAGDQIPGGATSFMSLMNAQDSDRQGANKEYGFQFINRETWAEETGGKAFHTNDLSQVLEDAVDHGAMYYTLAYVPTNRREEGRERKIKVVVSSGTYNLFYRRSYFERTVKKIKSEAQAPAQDPLRPLMDRGMPNSTQIPFTIKISQPAAQLSTDRTQKGGSPAPNGKDAEIDVSFLLNADGLALIPDFDGNRRRNLEVVLLLYDKNGQALNWEASNMNLLIKPEQWPKVRKIGVPFYFEIRVPSSSEYLRVGVYDRLQQKAGTLEIPLSAVTVTKP